MAARMGGVESSFRKRTRGGATTVEGASRRNGATDRPPGHARISGACTTGGVQGTVVLDTVVSVEAR